MSTPNLTTLLARRQELDEELAQIAYLRSLFKTEAERLKLIPEAVRITGAIVEVEHEINRHSQAKTG